MGMKTISVLSIGALLAAGATVTAYASPPEQLSGAVDMDCGDTCPSSSDFDIVDTVGPCSPGYEIEGTGSCLAPPDAYAAAELEESDDAVASTDSSGCPVDASKPELVCSEDQEICTQEYELALL